MTNSTALTGGNVTSLRKSGHTVKGYLFPVPMSTVATMRINQVIFEKPLAAIEVDGATGFADIQPGMTYWIGTTAGARDVHVGRIRGTVTNFILVEEFSSGDPGMLRLSELKSLANDLYITVKKDYNLHSVFPRISYSGGVNSRVGTFYKDFNAAYMDQNATIPAGILRIGQHRVSLTSPASFAFSAFAENWSVGTVDTYAWDVDGGNVTAGAVDEQHLTVEWTTGFYVISCTVTFDTGAEVTARRFVWVNQAGIPITPQNDTRDATGRRMTFRTPEGLLTLPDGAMAVYHEVASWGGDSIAEATTQFVGFARSVEHSHERGVQFHNFEMVSPMLAAGDLVAFSQELTKNSDPDNWQEAIHLLMHLDYWVFYLLYYHSTLPLLFDMEVSGLNLYLTQAWNVQAGSLGGAVASAGERLNCTVGQDSRGTIFIKRDPQFMNTTARDAVIERMTITEADIKLDTLNWGNNEIRNTTGKVEANGVSFDGSTLTPYKSQATGLVGGQGSRIATLNNQLVYAFEDPQAELDQRAACLYAKENNPYGDIRFTFIGNHDVFEPSEHYWARLNIGATYGPNGQAFNKRVLFKTIGKRYLGGGAAEIDATVEAEVYANEDHAQTEEIMPGEGANAGVLDGNNYYIPPTFNSDGSLNLDYDPFTPFPYMYPPVAPPQQTEAVTGYVFAWTANILYNSANLGTVWGTLHNPSDDIADFAYDNDSDWLINPTTGTLKAWLLTAAGLLYNSNAVGGGSWVSKQSFTGGSFLRKPAGVTDGIGVFCQTHTGSQTWDFTASDGGWTTFDESPSIPANGTYSAGVGWVSTFGSGFERIRLNIAIPAFAQITSMSIEFTPTPYTGAIFLWARTEGVAVGSYGPSLPGQYAIESSGTLTSPETGAVAWFKDGRLAFNIAGNASDTITITGVTVTWKGTNPWGSDTDAEFVFSDDTGTTVNTEVIGVDRADTGGDMDDYNLGVVIVGNEREIKYTTAYDGTFTTLTGLTGVDSETPIMVVRIPLKKLLTQVDNDNPASLQFIYGTYGDVSGSTLWAVTFDSTDGTILNQTDITPVIGGKTYYVIAPNALETAGADTRIILGLATPVAESDRKLIRTVNGGASWAITNNYAGNFVRWVPGSTQRAWMTEGVRYTTNRGSTLQNKNTGITGDALGVQGF